MDAKATSDLDPLLDLAISTRHDDLAFHTLATAAREDPEVVANLHHRLLSLLLSRSVPARGLRRTAELLAEMEELRRSRVSRLIDTHHAAVEGLRRLHELLPAIPRAAQPEAVTSQVCHTLGFAKSMFSVVRGRIWTPMTITIDRELDGFAELKRAVNGSTVPNGAAPREEDILRTPRGLTVEYADTLHSTYKPLIELSRPRGYVVVPVVAAGRVRAIIHADRDEGPIASGDLEVLRSVSDVCALHEETALVRARINASNRQIRDELIAMESALSDLEQTRVTIAEAAGARPAPGVSEGPANRVLTAREHEVLEQIARGRTNADIARRLYVSEGTVKSHLRRAFRKLEVSSRAEAAAAFRARYGGNDPTDES